MGKEKIYTIQILNADTGVKVKHQLDKYFQEESQAQLKYNELLEILQSYNPEIDVDNLMVYYFTHSKWLILLENQIINFYEHEQEWQDKQSDEIQLRVKYNCFYLLEEEEEKRFIDDVRMMNDKINGVSELYQDLKDKYKQEALDINVFWGSPLIADDQLQRNKRIIEYVNNSQDKPMQLLTNQVKYAPYINAVTTALQTCDKSKVHLGLNLLNERSFGQRNIFTVVYIIAHLEVQEIKDNSKPKATKNKHQQRQKEEKTKKKPKKYAQKKPTKQEKSYEQPKPVLKKTESQPLQLHHKDLALLQKQQSQQTNSLQFQMIIEQEQIQQIPTVLAPSISERQQFQQFLRDGDDTKVSELAHQQSKIQIKYQQDEEKNEDVVFVQDGRKRKRGYKYYFLGEEVNGTLIKITPKKLRSIIESKAKRNIELLILHSSFPNHHLKEIRHLANNIILINSNPLVPEPSSLYFIKQFFTHLLKTGNIQQTYSKSITDLNKLKEITTSPKNAPQMEFDQKDIKYISSINQKYVHGSMECCCCYHDHHEKCHNKKNTSPSKYAEYHYKYHASQCQCHPENLMIHTCDTKRKLLSEHYGVINQDSYYDKEVYYCCCMGPDLGFYRKPFRNTHLEQIVSLNEEKDPHSIKFKFRHQKSMINQEDNQLQINEGKITGDWSEELIGAFKYIQNNPLLGNARIVVKLFQLFTQQLLHSSLDTIRRSSQNDMYILCNIYGEKSTGRKTIATYFANLLLIKRLCKRIVIKPFNNANNIRGIIQNSMKEGEGRPFFIFIHQDKSSKGSNPLQLKQYHFGQLINAIIITDKRVIVDSSIKMEYIKPLAFSNDNCQHYIKKYKHLTYQAKNNVKVLFQCSVKGYNNEDPFQIYPYSLNQFQIINIVWKTNFTNYKPFIEGLDRLHKDFIQYYIFIMYTIKFTNSSRLQKQTNLAEIEQKLNQIKEERLLFFKKFDETLIEKKSDYGYSIGLQDIRRYYDELVNLQQLKDNFYLIFTSVGYKMVRKLPTILKMFINYTSMLEKGRFVDPNMRRGVNYIRMKQAPFFNQLYQATTINQSSYINRYYEHQFEQIYSTYAKRFDKENKDMNELQYFIEFHASLFFHKTTKRKLVYDHFSRPKEKTKSLHQFSSLDHFKEKPSLSHSDSLSEDDSKEASNIYHLASVIEGGLQFVRNILCNHFIYNRLSEQQKISLLKHSVFLINNCIILLKNKHFYGISGEFDLDQSEQDPNSARNFFYSTHSSSHLDSPDLKSRRSEQSQFPLPTNNRTFSGKEVFYPNRLFAFENSAIKNNLANPQQEKHSSSSPSDELLLKQLYRLSTFKGVLFLLDEIHRRLQDFSCEETVRIKICGQLLAIQIRLQQLQLDKQQIKVNIPANPDRHLARICQVFNQKNHNISILYHIVRNEINEGRFNTDIEQLGIIKSHIIVSLSLMASRYGKFKIIKAKSMIQQIDSFLQEWGNIPLQRRQSQQSQNRNTKKQEFLKVQDMPSQYGLLKMMCQNEYVYIHILEAFTSQKFWPRGFKVNQQIETYKDLLYIYYHFTLKNTSSKGDYYAKLQAFIDKLHELKNKRWLKIPTYIYNFLESFIRAVEGEFRKLRSSLIAVFNAEDGRYYIKKSLHEQLQPILSASKHEKGFFSIKKKFNPQSLSQLQSNCGCKYLCIFTSINQNNSKEEIMIETNQRKTLIQSKDKIAKSISFISSSVLFICLARKKMLAESIIQANKSKRSIVYFDFQIDNFQEFKLSSEYTAINDNIVIFEKMIMIEAVRQLLEQIMQKQMQGQKTIYKAFNTIKNTLCFILKDNERKPILKLTNQQFRKCIFLQEQIYSEQIMVPIREIQLFTSQKVSKKQIEQLQKIVKKASSQQGKFNEKKKYEEFKLDSFENVFHFTSVFSFYFRDKYGFDSIFDINFEVWKQQAKDPKSILLQKKFLEKLTQQKILDFIFSSKSGAIMMYFQPHNYEMYSGALKNCEKRLKDIVGSIDQVQNRRVISKLSGYTKSTLHIFIYILECQESQHQA